MSFFHKNNPKRRRFSTRGRTRRWKTSLNRPRKQGKIQLHHRGCSQGRKRKSSVKEILMGNTPTNQKEQQIRRTGAWGGLESERIGQPVANLAGTSQRWGTEWTGPKWGVPVRREKPFRRRGAQGKKRTGFLKKEPRRKTQCHEHGGGSSRRGSDAQWKKRSTLYGHLGQKPTTSTSGRPPAKSNHLQVTINKRWIKGLMSKSRSIRLRRRRVRGSQGQ